jgi:hypothetical protein
MTRSIKDPHESLAHCKIMAMSVFDAVKIGDLEAVIHAIHLGDPVDTAHYLTKQDWGVLKNWKPPLKNIPKFTALQWLAMSYWKNYNPEILQELLRNGANTEIKNDEGETPLMILANHYETDCTDQRIQMMKQLLDHGANPNALTVDGETPLFASMMGPSKLQVEMLIDKGANIHQKVDGYSMLQNAIIMHNEDIAILLIQYGANPGRPDDPNGVIRMAMKEKLHELPARMEIARAQYLSLRLQVLDVLAQAHHFFEFPDKRPPITDKSQLEKNIGSMGQDILEKIIAQVHKNT